MSRCKNESSRCCGIGSFFRPRNEGSCTPTSRKKNVEDLFYVSGAVESCPNLLQNPVAAKTNMLKRRTHKMKGDKANLPKLSLEPWKDGLLQLIAERDCHGRLRKEKRCSIFQQKPTNDRSKSKVNDKF
ncbi:hypothetical protein ACFX12_035508 [Malus domestica]